MNHTNDDIYAALVAVLCKLSEQDHIRKRTEKMSGDYTREALQLISDTKTKLNL